MDFHAWIRPRCSSKWEFKMKVSLLNRLQKRQKLLEKWIQTIFMKSRKLYTRLWARPIFWTNRSSKKHYLRKKIEILTQMPLNCELRVFRRLHRFCIIHLLFRRRYKALDLRLKSIRGWTLSLFRIWISISLVRQLKICTCPSLYERCITRNFRCASLYFWAPLRKI